MCGIAGWILGSRGWDSSVLRAMTDAIAHRGPDGTGTFHAISLQGAQVALGHRRLSIIDIAGGTQPMLSPDGTLAMVFNGEIYNFRELRDELTESHGHQFRTQSDSEVLLAAYKHWGKGCLDRLRGMYAFAIWDQVKSTLFLARDRFGKKPLYIARLRDGIAFASEIKALLQIPGFERRLDDAALRQYLVFRYAPGPRTFFAGIEKLQPGCHATCSGQGLTVERYFEAPEATESTANISDLAATQEYGRLLEESVKLRLVSDVPFGAFLSGGVDSSAIVALMSRTLQRPVRTFSVGFTGNDPGELPFASQVARHFATDHREIVISPEDIIGNIRPAIEALDAPVSEPATIPLLLLSRVAAQEVKMVLSGEGADEFLGGYTKHSFERFVPAYQRVPAALRRLVRCGVATLPRRRFERSLRALDALAEANPRKRYPLWFSAFEKPQFDDLFRPIASDLEHVMDWDAAAHRRLRGLLQFDQTSWLPDNLLERGDRMSMAASLEARMPFMDHQLATFTARLPEAMRIRCMTGKWLLRKAMRGILPPAILNRRKQGFPVPLAEWFRGPMHRTLQEVVLDSAAPTAGLFGRTQLERLLSDHRTRRVDATKPIWLFFNLNMFCDAYRLGV